MSVHARVCVCVCVCEIAVVFLDPPWNPSWCMAGAQCPLWGKLRLVKLS